MKRVGCRTMAFMGIAFLFFSTPAEGDWSKVADGLLLGEFTPSQKSPVEDHPVTILRIDPSRYSLRLLSALEHGGNSRTTREWCEEFGLLAAINASMYRSDLRSTGYMRNYRHTNNPAFNPAFGAFMAFNPKDPAMPPVRMVDSRVEKDWQSILDRYGSVLQNFRMISGGRKVKWPQQDKPHSTAAIGMDNAGHVLFILSRAPYTVHDFINILLALPIRIKDAMYVEGGDEASLSLRQNGKWVEWAGFSDLGLFSSQSLAGIPNVIGIVNR